jgi:hypothetical protein
MTAVAGPEIPKLLALVGSLQLEPRRGSVFQVCWPTQLEATVRHLSCRLAAPRPESPRPP